MPDSTPPTAIPPTAIPPTTIPPPAIPAQEAQWRQPEQVSRTIEKNALVPWSPPVGDSRMMFKELISANGKSYRIECEIPEEEDKDEWVATNVYMFQVDPVHDQVGVLEKGAGHDYYYANAKVHWEYFEDKKYQRFEKPSQEVIDDLHITEYKLSWNSWGNRDYRLDIKSNKCGDFTFYDDAGDYYNLSVDIAWWRHNVCYDSHSPNIVRIYAKSSSAF